MTSAKLGPWDLDLEQCPTLAKGYSQVGHGPISITKITMLTIFSAGGNSVITPQNLAWPLTRNGSDGRAEHLKGEGGHGLGRRLHPLHDVLELLVGHRGLSRVSLNNPAQYCTYSYSGSGNMTRQQLRKGGEAESVNNIVTYAQKRLRCKNRRKIGTEKRKRKWRIHMEGETTESKEHFRCEHVEREISTCRHGHFKGKKKGSDSTKEENTQVPWLYNISGAKLHLQQFVTPGS